MEKMVVSFRLQSRQSCSNDDDDDDDYARKDGGKGDDDDDDNIFCISIINNTCIKRCNCRFSKRLVVQQTDYALTLT